MDAGSKMSGIMLAEGDSRECPSSGHLVISSQQKQPQTPVQKGPSAMDKHDSPRSIHLETSEQASLDYGLKPRKQKARLQRRNFETRLCSARHGGNLVQTRELSRGLSLQP